MNFPTLCFLVRKEKKIRTKKKKEAALSVSLEKLNIGIGDIELVVINLLSGTKFHLTLQEHFICIILLV
jgi:hypothetical protein